MFIKETKIFGYNYSIGNDRFIFEFIVLEYGLLSGNGNTLTVNKFLIQPKPMKFYLNI